MSQMLDGCSMSTAREFQDLTNPYVFSHPVQNPKVLSAPRLIEEIRYYWIMRPSMATD